MKLVIQDANFEVSLFPFELPRVEIVFRISWLKTLGTIQANFEHLRIRFEKDGTCFELKGEPELMFRKVSIKTFSKEKINVVECFMVQMKNFMELNKWKKRK